MHEQHRISALRSHESAWAGEFDEQAATHPQARVVCSSLRMSPSRRTGSAAAIESALGLRKDQLGKKRLSCLAARSTNNELHLQQGANRQRIDVATSKVVCKLCECLHPASPQALLNNVISSTQVCVSSGSLRRIIESEKVARKGFVESKALQAAISMIPGSRSSANFLAGGSSLQQAKADAEARGTGFL